jgi:hypothetical protein
MAFDDPTRRLLQRFVNEARKELELEFTRQLQLVYGMDPGTGVVSPLDKLSKITDAQRETARILRDILAHYAAAPGADAKSALMRVLREQAFTVLNRLCALRLAEARGLLMESVGNGFQAKGFQLYQHLAGTGLGETGDAYRVYLFSVFDELAQDLPGLFDRYSPQGRLFPREAALLQVLALVNNPELESLWAEDETIGWIYQYFNSKEERKAMRDASQAPRNSRELAVRNQFFTPRYVVEFLTDNTLGRTWHEMTQGQTALKDQCRYMLIRPREVFLVAPDEYREEPRAEWLTQLRQGDFSAMPEDPSWDEISSVALSIDGYGVAERLGERVLSTVSRVDDGAPGQAPEFEVSPNGLVDQWVQSHERGEIFSSDPLVVWLVLFGWQRAVLRDPIGLEEDERTQERIRETYKQLRLVLQFDTSELSQELRLQRPVFVPQRAIKDPRELKILDPACGSGHFLLYAFDLLLTIYDEAWERGFIKPADFGYFASGVAPIQHDSVRVNPGSNPRSNYSHQDVPLAEAFMVVAEKPDFGDGVEADTPYLIHRDTKFRVPFKHRASLGEFDYPAALAAGWFTQEKGAELIRATGAFSFDTVVRQVGSYDEAKAEYLRQVPRLIIEHNLYGVDIDPRAAQIASLALWLRAQRAWHQAGIKAKDRPAVGHGHIIAAVAPPADKELREEFTGGLAVMDAELFGKTLDLLKGLPELGVLLQMEQELPRLIREVFGEHGDLWKEDDLAQWEKAEARLRDALTAFTHAAKATYQGRLFAQDALQGLRMIDLCRERFDVVLMNPPFGALASGTKEQLGKAYPRSKNDLLAIFVERGVEMLFGAGRLGAISSRTCFFLVGFQSWREHIILKSTQPEAMADLGYGVMDDAMVEAAAYVLERSI